MVDIPSFFRKADFYGVLLPGYLVVTGFLVLFRPEVLFNPTASISFDLFSAVMFVIFGPAVGLGLQQLHRRASVIVAFFRSGRETERPGKGADLIPPPPPALPRGGRTREYYKAYARVRLLATDAEKLELDLAESQYDFSLSTGIALVGLAGYHVALRGLEGGGLVLLLILGAGIFLAGGYVEWRYGFSPMIDRLIQRYPA